jgi:hypothetical protein
MNVYVENGYKSRLDYLCALSRDYGVPLTDVFTLAALLGESEDFDGLVVGVEDYEATGGF